jgi:hypothetical protein
MFIWLAWAFSIYALRSSFGTLTSYLKIGTLSPDHMEYALISSFGTLTSYLKI